MLDRYLTVQQTVLLVIDMQNASCGHPLVAEMLPTLRQFVDDARRVGVPIIWTRAVQTAETDSPALLALFERYPGFRDISREGSPAAAYAPGFGPAAGETEIVKHRYSAFAGTSLMQVLRSRRAGTLVLAGVMTDVCVGSTAREAFDRDFHVVLVADCTASASAELQRASLTTHLANFGLVASSAEIVSVWASATA
jgi:ureidoacrylate peracid hydrolase